MSTAALLSRLLSYKCALNRATMDNIFWSEKYNSNHEQLAKFEKMEAAWDKAHDKAIGNSKSITINGITISENNQNEALAARYAKEVTGYTDDYIQYMMEDLNDLDTEYDLRKVSLEALMEELKANIESTKNEVGKSAQDTHMIGGN